MIDISTIVRAKYPSSGSWDPLHTWSPDGGRIAYVLSGYTGSNIMVYSIPERTSKLLVSDVRGLLVSGNALEHTLEPLCWTKDGKNVVYNKMHAVYKVPAKGGEPKLLASAKLITKASMLSPDLKNLAFIKDDAIWIKPVPEAEPYQLTEKIPVMKGWGAISGWPFLCTWSPDGKKIAIQVLMDGMFDIGVVSLENGKVLWIDPSDQADVQPVWSHDSSKLTFVRASSDGKRVELRVSSVSGDDVKSVWTVTDERWVGHGIVGASWSHDDRRIAFISNRDGWNHLYVAPVDGGEPEQLTKGNYAIPSPVFPVPSSFPAYWSPDDSEIAFVSNRDSPQERHIWVVPSSGGEARKLDNMRGFSPVFKWSPDGKYVSFIHSSPSQTPSLWIVEASGEKKPIPIYNSLPEGVSKEDLAKQEAVKYESTNGTVIHAVLLTPKDLKKDKKYPAVVLTYGLIAQTATLCHDWYPFLTVLFESYLVQKGYVVLKVDPRGTSWYGKNFETAVHYEAGGVDVAVQDVASAAKYLAGLGYVDPKKIGLLGASWGGWMTAQTLVQAPEAFKAGVADCGVYDLKEAYFYRAYEGSGFNYRWGGDIKKRPDLYDKWSPANHVDKLKATIFVVHGDMDVNAPFSHAKKLVNALIKEGKDFEFMMYPDQPHSWTSPEVAQDYLKRVERFFNKHLKRQ